MCLLHTPLCFSPGLVINTSAYFIGTNLIINPRLNVPPSATVCTFHPNRLRFHRGTSLARPQAIFILIFSKLSVETTSTDDVFQITLKNFYDRCIHYSANIKMREDEPSSTSKGRKAFGSFSHALVSCLFFTIH
jgi:hypothetical protein